jgi:pyridoxine kinase
MARVLILSSFVAARRVGGGAQALALARLGVEPVLVPTVLYGRHPGLGPPGGNPVADETFEAMLAGIEAQGLFRSLDAVITGHFSSADQVAIAAQTAARVRAAAPAARIIVDPIMGDTDTGLYVREPVAEAIAGELVPIADVVASNAWELARLSGHDFGDLAGAAAAARQLGKPTLVSSVRAEGKIGAAYVAGAGAWVALHPEVPTAPRGTGDFLTVVFVASLLSGKTSSESLALSVSALADAVEQAKGADELPLEAFPTRLSASPHVPSRRL